MRIDKFLKNSRIIKRRTVAKEACEQGRIMLNDKVAKPGAEVQEGDQIFVQFGNGSLRVEVVALLESCRKEAREGSKLCRGQTGLLQSFSCFLQKIQVDYP